MRRASLTEDAEKQVIRALEAEFRPALVRYFKRRVGVAEEIPDLVQDVFVRLLVCNGMAHVHSARGYVFQTAHSVFVDWLRKRGTSRAEAHEPFDPGTHGAVDDDPYQLLVTREELDRLVQALMELPERSRTIFVLRRIEGMKYEQIARRLGVSLSTVEKHMHQTIKALAERNREN